MEEDTSDEQRQGKASIEIGIWDFDSYIGYHERDFNKQTYAENFVEWGLCEVQYRPVIS